MEGFLNTLIEKLATYFPQLIALFGGSYGIVQAIKLLINLITKKAQSLTLEKVQTNTKNAFESVKPFIYEIISKELTAFRNEYMTELTKSNNQTTAIFEALLAIQDTPELRVAYEKALIEKENRLIDLQLELEKKEKEIKGNVERMAQTIAESLQKEQHLSKAKKKKLAKTLAKETLKDERTNKITLE